MTSQEILRADVLDILFEKRNKLYGAYTLRKNYVSRLYLALGIALGSVGLFVFLGGIGDTGKDGRSNAPLFIRPMTAEDLHLHAQDCSGRERVCQAHHEQSGDLRVPPPGDAGRHQPADVVLRAGSQGKELRDRH